MSADLVHATSVEERDALRSLGVTAPIVVIPDGVSMPDLVGDQPSSSRSNRTVLILGRFHPIKGLPSLLRAWSQVECERPEWRLSLAGRDEQGSLAELRSLAGRLGLARVDFLGPVRGEEKDELLRSADLLVLPSLSENFGIVVAEALSYGLAVIASRRSPWAGLETQRCGWWVEPEIDALANSLRIATGLPREELNQMGVRGRAWAEDSFSWDHVSQAMLETYEWIRSNGERPSWVDS